MQIQSEDIREVVRHFILAEFLPGEDHAFLKDSTPLITGGIIDSISTTRLVTHLESTFNVVFDHRDVTVRNFDTVADVVAVTKRKLGLE